MSSGFNPSIQIGQGQSRPGSGAGRHAGSGLVSRRDQRLRTVRRSGRAVVTRLEPDGSGPIAIRRGRFTAPRSGFRSDSVVLDFAGGLADTAHLFVAQLELRLHIGLGKILTRLQLNVDK